MVLLEIKRLWN